MCVYGDFNDLLYASDKHGEHPHPQSLMDGFRLTVEDCKLVEMDLVGGNFTWEKSNGKSNWVKERLDRAFATEEWWKKFPLCTLKVSHAICSDHEPIQISLYDTSVSRKQFRFRFENSWLKEPSFKEETIRAWKEIPVMSIILKLISLSKFMSKWGRKFFHKFRDKVKQQKEVLVSLLNREDNEGVAAYFEERERLNELLLHEEVYWKQRAKNFWLKEGDTNLRFFHTQATKRKKLNNIAYFKMDTGEKIDDVEQMQDLTKQYFGGVYSAESNVTESSVNMEERVISEEQNQMLTASIKYEEFTEALKQMHPDKASGPDGYSPAFFQQFWDLVGREVFLSSKKWLDECMFPTELNNTNLVLIPKKENVKKLTDVRPIALCNVV